MAMWASPSTVVAIPQSYAALLFQVNRLPQLIRQDYLLILREFLERYVICAVTSNATTYHATHACKRLRAVLDFRPDQDSEALKLHIRLQFLELTMCWHCMSP
jgi:hypothetical protein